MTEPRVFEKQLFAGWGDMDFNSHMRNTAFDKSALSARRLVLPPDVLLAALRSLPQTDDFQVLPSGSRSKADGPGGGSR